MDSSATPVQGDFSRSATAAHHGARRSYLIGCVVLTFFNVTLGSTIGLWLLGAAAYALVFGILNSVIFPSLLVSVTAMWKRGRDSAALFKSYLHGSVLVLITGVLYLVQHWGAYSEFVQ